MPARNQADYMRDYRARKKAQEMPPVIPVVEERAPRGRIGKDAEKPLDKKSFYRCGCRGKALCTAHAIQRLPRRQIDKWLDIINWCKKHPMRDAP